MPHSTYPETADLLQSLVDAGLADYAPSNVSGALLSAIATWRRDCDFSPYLAKAEASERHFTLNCATILFLPCPIVEAPISVFVDGIELFSQVDYWLEPGNALEDSEPFTRLRFRFRRSSDVQGCVVTARWGVVAELPDDVFRGIVALAAWELRGEVQRRFSDAKVAEANAAQIIKAKESGPLRVEFQTVDGTKTLDLSATFNAWHTQYDDCLVGRVNRNP